MRLFKFSSAINTWIPVGALAVTFGFISLTSHASTGSSWSDKPVWATDDSTPTVHRASLKSSSDYVSPFAPGTHNIALDVGQVFLMGDLAGKYSDNLGTQVHYTYGVSDIFGFDSSLGYSEHSDGKYSLATLLTGLRTNLSWYDKVIPYLVFGLGFYKPTFQEAGAGPNGGLGTASPILFGVHIGPGVDLQVTRNLFFGTAITFHDIFGGAKTTTPPPIEIGGAFVSFYVHAGVTF